LRLVTLSEHNENTRRRTPRSELLALAGSPQPPTPSPSGRRGENQNVEVPLLAQRSGEGFRVRAEDLLEEIIDTYAAYRLLSLDNDPNTRTPTVEVAHEAILSEWKRLKQWISESREDIEMQQQITHMAAEWDEANHDTSYLVSGLRLQQMEAWATEAKITLTPIEQAFLQASITERDERKAAEHARKAYEAGLEQQSVQRLRWLVATFAIATVIAGILSVVAFAQRNVAQQRADELYSLSLVSAAQDAMRAGDNGLALSLAMESITNETPSEDTERVLESLAQQPGPLRSIYEGDFTAWTPSRDYRYVAVGSEDGTVTLIDMSSDEVIRQFEGHLTSIVKIQFSFDTTRLLAWASNGRLLMWDVETGASILVNQDLDYWIANSTRSPILMPDNRAFLFKAIVGRSIVLLDAETGEQITTYPFDDEPLEINVLSVSSDGQLAAVGGWAGRRDQATVVVSDMTTGEIISRFDNLGLNSPVSALGFFPDGTTLWASSADETLLLDADRGTVLLRLFGHMRQQFVMGTGFIITDYQGGTVWDLETGNAVARLPEVNNFHMLPDGRTVLIETADKLELWDVNAHIQQLQQFEIQGDFALAVAYSPDGRYALTGGGAVLCPYSYDGYDNRLILWAVETGTIQREMLGHETTIMDIAFSPDGRYAVSGSEDGIAILWDVTTGNEVRRFAPQIAFVSVSSIVFRPDGHTVAISYALRCVDREGEVIVWNIDNGEILHQIPSPFLNTYWIPLSSDGQLTAFIEGATVSIVDVTKGEEITNIQSISHIADAVFAHDGQTLFLSHDNGQITQWDVATGEQMQTLDTIGQVYDVEVSPDGKYLVSARGASCQTDSEQEFILWDLASGQPVRQWNLPACGFNFNEFSPDGQTLMVGSNENIHIYAVENPSTPEWIRANRYIREFTCAERQQYRIEPLCAE
jgi:WD40 repeat protein